MNPKALIRLLLETSGHADQNVAKFLARDTDALMDAMRGGKVDELLRGSSEGRALLNNAEFMRMTTKVSGNLDYITRTGNSLAAGRPINASEFLSKMDIPAQGNTGSALTQSITNFNAVAARSVNTTANNADAIAAARRTRAPRDLSADEVAARLERAKAAPPAGAAKPAAAAADDAAAAAAKQTADTAAQAAAKPTGTLSRREINRILDGSGSTADKLGILTRGGRDDLYDRVILQARRHGLKEGDNAAIQNSKLPDALKARVQEISDIQMKGGWAARMDSLKATFSSEGIKDLAASAAAHPGRTAYNVFAAQWRVPLTTLKWAGQNKVAAAGIVGAASGADLVTGGASTEILGTGAKTVAGAYIAADSMILSTGAQLATGLVGAVTSEPAEQVLDSAGTAAAKTTFNVPGMLTRAYASATGTDPEAAGESVAQMLDNPVVRMVAPGWVRNVAHVNDASNAVQAATNPNAPGADGIALATADGSAPSAGDRLAGAASQARDMAGEVKDQAADSLAALDVASMMKDPAKAMASLREFAKDNPAMQKALDIAEQNPMLKWGLIGGFALGAAGDARSPGQRIANGLKTALVLGVMLDLMGALFGKPSLIVASVRDAMSNNNGQNPAGAKFVPAPAAPGAAPNASPDASPEATPPAVAPAATAPATAAPTSLKGNFATQAAAPAPDATPDPASTSFAFKNATLNTTTPVAVTATPVAPAANDPDYRRSIYMPSSM